MRWLTKYMGAYTHSALDRAVIARYFAFLVISQLIIFTLIGVLFSEYYITHVRSIGAHIVQTLFLRSFNRSVSTRVSRTSSTTCTVCSFASRHQCILIVTMNRPSWSHHSYLHRPSVLLAHVLPVRAGIPLNFIVAHSYCRLRGFLCVFDLAQILNLVVIFVKKQSVFHRPLLASGVLMWSQSFRSYPSRDSGMDTASKFHLLDLLVSLSY